MYTYAAITPPAAMESYCQVPPIVSQAIQPNIMLALDVSGSMSWCGYYTGANSSHPCDPNCASGPGGTCGYQASITYDGYFNPDEYYNQDSDGIWQEFTPTGLTCTTSCVTAVCKNRSNQCSLAGKYGSGPATGASACSLIGGNCAPGKYCCCTATTTTGDCGVIASGNFLNYAHMQRIDLLRWSMTGGSPSTCTGSATFNSASCDPELWSQTGNTATGKVGTVCGNNNLVNGDGVTQSGCILRSSDGTLVKVPWERISGLCSVNPLTNTDPITCADGGGQWTPSGGLAFTFSTLSIRPRMGEVAFGGSQVVDSIYMGDFTAPNSTNNQFPYLNLITHLNSLSGSGSTPTGGAMWDVLNYYSQTDPEYSGTGGLSPQSGSGDHWKNPMYICDQGGSNCLFVPCAGNYVILISDGQWNTPSCSIGSNPACTSHTASDPVVPAYCMHNGFTNTKSAVGSDPNVSTKVSAVYTIGLFTGSTGEQALKNVAMYGSFDNGSKTWPDSLTGFPAGTCHPDDCSGVSATGSSCTALPSSSIDWDKNGDGTPDTYYHANDATGIKETILSAVLDILKRTSSGTAVSILASGEGSGANLLQAFFYPKKDFANAEIDWTGEMQNLWYYLDPKLQRNTIREDTDSNMQLEQKNDYLLHFRFDSTQNKTVADRLKDNYDSNNNWLSSAFIDTVGLDRTKNLWEAGLLLWHNPATSRTLYTTTDAKHLMNFSTAAPASLKSYLQAASNAEASNLMQFIRGIDVASYCLLTGNACTNDTNCTSGAGDMCVYYRPRTVTINPVPPNHAGITTDTIARVWKLGDIISSTPRLQSWIRLNTYDSDAPTGYGDNSYSKYAGSLDYKTRGMVYAGANDGMLHAFKLGTLAMINDPADKLLVAKLCDDTSANGKCEAGETSTASLGTEEWAFIPKNSLPYLRYLADLNYCHLFYVDATPYLFDASINKPSDCTESDYSTCTRKTTFTKDASGNNTKHLDVNKTSWRTILIGGMGQGGACSIAGSTCSNCVTTPTVDPNPDPSKPAPQGLGYSSYFALDVTDPQNPTLLWEFSDPALGFSTSGPAVVRVGDKSKNGKWYVVFASGPTGPIDTASYQFLGKSNQTLQFFVVDLKTGDLVRTIPTGLLNAFGGSLMNGPVDADRWRPDRTGNYKDDVLYAGYTQQSGTSWVGGVLRITTKEADPGQWNVSTVINGIGPVTSAISHLQDRTNHKLWLYFGTGRYFYKINTSIDDADAQRKIFGLKDPCYVSLADRYDPACTTCPLGSACTMSLTDATTSPPSSEPANGWVISLDSSSTSNKAERVITNPLAAFTGAVFFTTFSPSADACGFSGNSYLWAVNYATGGSAPSSSLKGTALIQVSTGEIKEVALPTAFTDKIPSGGTKGRRTAGFKGVPPKGQGLSVVINPKAIKKIMHMQEK
jgi:type IV pilus assembly protein PilY1